MTAILGDRIFDTPPLLAVLTAGTTSMIAGDVGVRGAARRRLRRLLGWARSPDDARASAGAPGLATGALPRARHRLFGMFFGTAAIEQGIRFCLTASTR